MKFIQAKSLKAKPTDISALKFGKSFTDYMLECDYAEGEWGETVIRPYEDFLLSPATMCLHYGQGIFEGAKAFRNDSGEITLFRIDDNLSRMNRSAERMCMPQFPLERFRRELLELLNIERDWVPSAPQTSLYIRPTMVATEVAVGVHSANRYKYFVILSPVGPYINGFEKPQRIYVEDEFVRAVEGGTGEAKCLGNYAGGILATTRARKNGYNEVLWLDAKERRYVEEVGTMNVLFVVDDEVYTPSLRGSILRGITRDSAIKLLKDENIKVHEQTIEIDWLLNEHQKGKLTEMFGVGTAAVVSPVGMLAYKGNEYVINGNKSGEVAKLVYDRLDDIRKVRVPDKYGWLTFLEQNQKRLGV